MEKYTQSLIGMVIFILAGLTFAGYMKNKLEVPYSAYPRDANNDGIVDIVTKSQLEEKVYFGVKDKEGNIEYLTAKDLGRKVESLIEKGYKAVLKAVLPDSL